jgi:hypothetical protein
MDGFHDPRVLKDNRRSRHPRPDRPRSEKKSARAAASPLTVPVAGELVQSDRLERGSNRSARRRHAATQAILPPPRRRARELAFAVLGEPSRRAVRPRLNHHVAQDLITTVIILRLT